MIFGVKNWHKSYTVRKLVRTDLTVICLGLCETGKKLGKIKQEKTLHFFLLAMAVPVFGLIKKASLNGYFWISVLRWERRLSWFLSVVVHDCENAQENIGKTTYFNQDFPWHYLNSGPTQNKRNSIVVLRVKNWSRNIRLTRFLDETQNRNSNGQQGKMKIFLLVYFFWFFPHTIQGKLP